MSNRSWKQQLLADVNKCMEMYGTRENAVFQLVNQLEACKQTMSKTSIKRTTALIEAITKGVVQTKLN